MKRKISAELEKFYASKETKAFLLKGARQVGKTYAVKEFLASHYEPSQIVYIDFLRQPEAKEFFLSAATNQSKSLLPQLIIQRIANNIEYQHLDLASGKIAIFLDEIQECPTAMTALKFFALERDKYDVYASSSYLGFAFMNLDGQTSFPTGYIHQENLFGLDFEEFLWANGYTETYTKRLKSSIKSHESFDSSTHETLLDLFHKYIIIGSLPKPINTFIENRSLKETRKVLKDLYSDYCSEMNKHLSAFTKLHAGDSYSLTMAIKNKAVFDSIPTQLRQQNKKFVYRRIAQGGRERMYLDNILWLKTAGLVYDIIEADRLSVNLNDYTNDENFKLFCFDTGILLTQFDQKVSEDILNQKEGDYASSLSIGGVYENAICNILIKYWGDEENIFYYSDGQHEIDFVYQENGSCVAVEVKSGNNLQAKSLESVSSKTKDVSLIRISQKQISESEFIEYPFYAFALKYSR